MDKGLRAVIYSRVSTERQDTTNQIGPLLKLAMQRGFDCRAIYKESESAWHSGHQKELARLKDDARHRRFDIVLVWALDRLSREGALAILSLIHLLKQYGVRVISYQEAWTEAPGELAEVLYALAGWVARMESKRRSERTKAGMARAKVYGTKSGKPIGRPPGSKDKGKKVRPCSKLKGQS